MLISLYTALLAILFIMLSINVIRTRRAFKVAVGDLNNFSIQRCIRAQANFAEYTPIFLIMLGLAEYNGMYAYLVHLFGLIFLCGRMSHAYGLLKAEEYENGILLRGVRYRVFGMQCTFISIAILAFVLLYQFFI